MRFLPLLAGLFVFAFVLHPCSGGEVAVFGQVLFLLVIARRQLE
jgi:hypothetical protein